MRSNAPTPMTLMILMIWSIFFPSYFRLCTGLAWDSEGDILSIITNSSSQVMKFDILSGHLYNNFHMTSNNYDLFGFLTRRLFCGTSTLGKNISLTLDWEIRYHAFYGRKPLKYWPLLRNEETWPFTTIELPSEYLFHHNWQSSLAHPTDFCLFHSDERQYWASIQSV